MADPARAKRLAKRISTIVASAIEYEIKDPRLAGVTITDSSVTGDLHDATLYYTVIGRAIDEAPAPLAKALATMRLFVLLGWAIYPIGFLMARAGAGEYREVIYNVADVVNKVGFGLVAYHGIKAMGHPGREAAA